MTSHAYPLGIKRVAVDAWWQLHAALTVVDYRVPCRSAPSLWTSDTPSQDEIDYAIAHCLRCPVRVECADYADTAAEDGVWGGTYRPRRGRVRPTEDALIGEGGNGEGTERP